MTMEKLKTEKYILPKEMFSELKKRYFKLNFDTKQLITHAVDNSTIRAFHFGKSYKKYKPISIFRSWAFNFLVTQEDILKTECNFNIIHTKARKSLEKYWGNKEGGITPEFYKILKIIDLLFKFIPRWNKLNANRQSWYFNCVHVPIDSFSLKLLKASENTKPYLGIKSSSSMSFVENLKHYRKIQNTIKKLVENNYPPIVFDLIAWNSLHDSENFSLQECKKSK
jgi:hypothetical protein